MAFMTFLQAQGNFESKISREEVVTELTKIARRPYSATGVSPRRLRSSYPIPYTLYWEWRVEDTKLGQEEGT
jgi:hypothetical protein